MTLNMKNRLLKERGLRYCVTCDKERTLSAFSKKHRQSLRTSCNGCRVVALESVGSGLPTELQGQRIRERSAERGREAKALILAAYGSACACCGESNPRYLTLDHINGCGKERRRTERGGTKLYLKLKNKGFPKGEFRVLCFNCNCGRREHFLCPPGSHGERIEMTG